MSFTETRLVNPTQLTTSASSALYTVPTGKSAIIKQLVVTNTTASPANFTFYINGTTIDKALFRNTSVAGNDAVVINLSQVINSGETVNALASANTTLNLTVSGVVNDGPLNPLSIYIADNSITTTKIADSNVTTSKIADGAITTAKIANNAVVTADIANNAVTQAKLSTDIPLSGFRNVIINGGFDLWQRGTSTTITGPKASSYLADRWSAYRAVGGSTQSRVSAGLDGFQYAMRIQRNSGNTDVTPLYIGTSFETSVVEKLANRQVVLSFYAKAGANYSASGSNLLVRTGVGTGTEANVIYDSYTSYSEPSATNVVLTTSWQQFVLYFTIPAGSRQAGCFFTFSPTGTAGANDFFDITGVQLEQNTAPTPFEQRPIGIETSLCQRYYERFQLDNAAVTRTIGPGGWDSATSFSLSLMFKTLKRTTPTMSSSNSGFQLLYHGIAWYTGTTTTFTEPSVYGVRANIASSGSAVQGQAGIAVLANTSAFMAADSEL